MEFTARMFCILYFTHPQWRGHASRIPNVDPARAVDHRTEAVQPKSEPALRRPQVKLSDVGVINLLQVLLDEALLRPAEGPQGGEAVEGLGEVSIPKNDREAP